MTLAFYDHAWPLTPETCPPDLDFIEWMCARPIRNASIFHFGTGAHHIVGRALWEHHFVTGMTASPSEFEKYVDLAIMAPAIGARYKVWFGDIYSLNARQMPEFDVVTLFHLGEFVDMPRSYPHAQSDLELLFLFIQRLKPAGELVLYPDSMGWHLAAPAVKSLVDLGLLCPVERFRSLEIYRRATDGRLSEYLLTGT